MHAGRAGREIADHAATWAIGTKVDALKHRTALVVTSDDGLAEANEAFAAGLRRAGDTHVTTLHLRHRPRVFRSAHRTVEAVLEWLAGTAAGTEPAG